MSSLSTVSESTFWNKLEELSVWLKSHADSYILLNQINESAEKVPKKSLIYSVAVVNKETILQKIEEIVLKFLEDLSNGSSPKFVLNKRGSYVNTKYSNGKGVEMLGDVTSHEISLENPMSRRKYTIMMDCLATCYKLLQKNTHATKRDIYYSNVVLFQNQHAVDEAIADISCMLGVPRYCLNVLSSSKGFVGGDLIFKDADENVIKCCVIEGVQVPNSIDKLHDFESNAKYILLIEKEAIYQRLMEFSLSEKLGPCILITGKQVFSVCFSHIIFTCFR